MLRKVHAGALLVCCLLLVQCGVGGDLAEVVPDATDLFEAGATLSDSTAGEGFIEPGDIEDLVDRKPDLPDSPPLDVSIPDTCQPTCDGKDCGDDGCGGSCGECDEEEWCTDDGLCEPANCDIILDCSDNCPQGDVTCYEECIAAAPLEVQIIYQDWDTCLGSTGYYFDGPCGEEWEDDPKGWDDCMFDFLISQCGDEYYACWPPGEGLCIDLHLCFISCPEDETYITCANDCYADASLEALDLWDMFIDCMDDNGYFGCAEGDFDCKDAAWEKCGPQLKECAHGELSCAELLGCSDDCEEDDGLCVETCQVHGTILAQEIYEELEDCIVSQCPQEPDADCAKSAISGTCLGEHTVCLGCEPDCDGKECGDNGCEGSCGECDDDYLCTNDTCDATVGQCIHLAACDDGNACSTDLCDPKTGECEYIFIDPDDGNPCTEDLSDPQTGCQNLVLPDGTPCLDVIGWVCMNGACVCVPDCEGQECGPDGCGGGCGECAQKFVCEDGACIIEIPGIQCGDASQCPEGSSYCIDGFCCNTTCNELCEACNLPGKEGLCSQVPANMDPGNDCPLCEACDGAGKCTPAPDGSDPGDDCIETSPTTCGQDGTCDGQGVCRTWKPGTICQGQFCEGYSFHFQDQCGYGTCFDSGYVSCCPYACNPEGDGCLESCEKDEDCCSGSKCGGQWCVPE